MNLTDLVSAPARPSRMEDMTGLAAAVLPTKIVRTDGWLPPSITMTSSSTGDYSYRPPYQFHSGYTHGTGRTFDDPYHARFLAVCEALERQASYTYSDTDYVAAAANDLPGAVLDLDHIPRASAAELRDPACILRSPPAKSARIRWCQGVNLHDSTPTWVPAIMTFLLLEAWYHERFWIPFSTGIATHQTMAAALAAGILEVVERDAFTLAWLQKLPLPLVDEACLPKQCVEIVEWCEARGLQTFLFDATTDLAIPCVLCLQIDEDSQLSAQRISSASGLDMGRAALKSVLECLGLRSTMHASPRPPRRYGAHSGTLHGALVMSRPAKFRAFRFLTDGASARPRRAVEPVVEREPAEELAEILRRLHRADQAVYAVDMTSREMQAAGTVGCKAIAPGLMPMSLRQPSQYRGTPRLYDAPTRMGHRSHAERDLNTYPIPMT